MKTFMMNLDRAPERLEVMRRRFSQVGLSFERVGGIDGRLLEPAEMDRLLSGEGRWGRLTPGEIGCFLSHRACWRALFDAGDRYGAIFEDDVVLGENAGRVLSGGGWIPHDADIVKLETTASRVYLDMVARGDIDGRKLFRLRSSHYCAAGYIISRQCAERLLAGSETFSEALDDFLFSALSPMFPVTTIYQLAPAICIQKWGVLGDENSQDPMTSIEGRGDKQRRVPSFGERLREVYAKESRSFANKALEYIGKRQRQRVEFR